MKTYLLTSDKFEGEIELIYDEYELLSFYENRATLDLEQKRYFLMNMPRSLAGLDKFVHEFKTIKVTEVKQQITFEMFWNKYDNKTLSNKKRTLNKWNTMSESERIKAFNFVHTYFANLASGVSKKYAESFLNAGQWNN